MSLRALGTFADLLSERGAVVSESQLRPVTLDGLSSEDAAAIVRLAIQAGLVTNIVDGADQELDEGELARGLAPFTVSFEKPEVTNGVGFITTTAFRQWLRAPTDAEVVRVASSTVNFEVEAFAVMDWELETPGSQFGARTSPRKLVRSNDSGDAIPSDIRPFILTEASERPWRDRAFVAWLVPALRANAIALANEVDAAQRIHYTSPTRLTFLNIGDDAHVDRLGVAGFESVQSAVRWVYDIDREADLRHQLFTQEFSRLANDTMTLTEALAKFVAIAVDGAKIAYGFSLQEMSRDALKGLSELRRAIADETQKLAESTRQLALSAAGAEFYALGLLAGRLSTSLNPWLIDGMALVGLIYVLVVLYINWRFLQQQGELRLVWKVKLYRYLTDSEYSQMVSGPTKKAENVLRVMIAMVLLLSVVTFAVVIAVNHTQVPASATQSTGVSL